MQLQDPIERVSPFTNLESEIPLSLVWHMMRGANEMRLILESWKLNHVGKPRLRDPHFFNNKCHESFL
jgi:hypothetical protein